MTGIKQSVRRLNMRVILGFLAFFGVFAQAQEASASVPGSKANDTVVGLNQESLSRMEASWLSIPNHCKAKGFNANPVSIEHPALSSEIMAIYGV
jgi:hypothetical protein